jgi:hypothetical protein
VTRLRPRPRVQRLAAFLLIAIFLAFLVFSRGRLWGLSYCPGFAGSLDGGTMFFSRM